MPWLPDVCILENPVWWRAEIELVVSRCGYHVQQLFKFIENYVNSWLRHEEDRFIALAGKWNEHIFRDFLCAPIAMSMTRDITDFLSRFKELPFCFQRLIITHISSIKQFSHMNRLLDFVYIVSELQRLELEFPGRLTFQDYEFAHWWWSDWFYRNIAHVRARLEGRELF